MSIYEKNPAYCERVAHIAEKAMPICKDMAKLYLMFHEKTTTVFERRKNMKKILSFVLVFAMIMAVTSTAFAATGNFTDKEIFGGSSQDVFTGARSRTNNVIVKVTKTVGLKSGFRFRGYDHSTGSTCTGLSDAYPVSGDWVASYTSLPNNVRVKMSIASTDPDVSMKWSGSITV